MPREQLDGSQVLGLMVDQRRLDPIQRMRPGLVQIGKSQI
jgi:hypothetical protein